MQTLHLSKKLMVKNAPTLAVRGVDTAEDEPSKAFEKQGCRKGVVGVICAGPFANQKKVKLIHHR